MFDPIWTSFSSAGLVLHDTIGEELFGSEAEILQVSDEAVVLKSMCALNVCVRVAERDPAWLFRFYFMVGDRLPYMYLVLDQSNGLGSG